jgi:DnaJ-domain-containing protein 1
MKVEVFRTETLEQMAALFRQIKHQFDRNIWRHGNHYEAIVFISDDLGGLDFGKPEIKQTEKTKTYRSKK